MLPNPPKKGDEIRAEHIAALYEAYERIKFAAIPPLHFRDDNTLELGEQPGIWIKITGAPTGTAHPWKEQQATTGGAWQDAVMTGTTTSDPAYELNGSTATLTGKIVRAWRDRATYEMRFLYASC
jgi:hypothetical protein